MDTLLVGLSEPEEGLLKVQDEPDLEIALPQVFTQPPLVQLQRGKLPHVELVVARLHQATTSRNGTNGLGADYQALVNEFQPLFAWAIACWDFLLSTEGCRFVLRSQDEQLTHRGDYRVVTDRDFSRLLHRIFRQDVLAFAQRPLEQSLAGYLRTHFWDAVVEAYRRLEDPPDPAQRKLSPYSYLRCIPYQFLNAFHHERVMLRIHQLPPLHAKALSLYFLNFLTLPATADRMHLSVDSTEDTLRRSLLTLLVEDRLVYCLLRQIERY